MATAAEAIGKKEQFQIPTVHEARIAVEQGTPLMLRNILWSVEEAAPLLGVSAVTIKRLIRRGRLESVKVGERRLIPHRSLVRYFLDLLSSPTTKDHTLRVIESHCEATGKPFVKEEWEIEEGI